MRGSRLQDVQPQAARALHLSLRRVSTADELGVWGVCDFPQIPAPWHGSFELLRTADFKWDGFILLLL